MLFLLLVQVVILLVLLLIGPFLVVILLVLELVLIEAALALLFILASPELAVLLVALIGLLVGLTLHESLPSPLLKELLRIVNNSLQILVPFDVDGSSLDNQNIKGVQPLLNRP